MQRIDIGQPAPPFHLTDQHGQTHDLRDYAGAPLVLYFYPEDDTAGCTDEACQFRDALPRFRKGDIAVLGVSPDDRISHERFAAKHRLSFPILSDTTHEVCEAYGVWEQRPHDGKTRREVARTTYLVDAQGLVAHRWDDVSIPGHAEEVLARSLRLTPSQAPAIEHKPGAESPRRH
jgi:peroxiredoxin Q/BCP